MRAALVVFSLLAFASAHSWMRVPFGKFANNTPQASTTSPCGDGTGYPNVTTVMAGRQMAVSWESNGHDTSTASVTLSLLDTNETVYSVLITTTYASGSDTASQPNPLYIRIPRDTTPGSYVLQWSWSGWYTCAALDIIASNVTSIELVPDTPLTGRAVTSTYTYYDFTYDQTDELPWVEIDNAPTGAAYISAVIGMDASPDANNNVGSGDSSKSSTITFGGCNDAGLTTYTIAVIGENGATGTYDIKASHYSGLVNINDVIDSDAHTGYKWYRTASFETPDTKRRTVIDVNGAASTELGVYALDCALLTGNKTAVAIGSTKQCFQLSTADTMKYIRIPAQQFSYSIFTEVGDCKDVAAGASTIISSVALAFALVFALLF